MAPTLHPIAAGTAVTDGHTTHLQMDTTIRLISTPQLWQNFAAQTGTPPIAQTALPTAPTLPRTPAPCLRAPLQSLRPITLSVMRHATLASNVILGVKSPLVTPTPLEPGLKHVTTLLLLTIFHAMASQITAMLKPPNLDVWTIGTVVSTTAADGAMEPLTVDLTFISYAEVPSKMFNTMMLPNAYDENIS